jgi:hypothetical protein
MVVPLRRVTHLVYGKSPSVGVRPERYGPMGVRRRTARPGALRMTDEERSWTTTP